MQLKTENLVSFEKPLSALERFEAAFERLKANKPIRLPKGTPVSQNNVAKEAGADPSALRKSRYPSLIRAIQTYVELRDASKSEAAERQIKRREHKKSLKEEIVALKLERDFAQSQLVNSHLIVLNLLREKADLQNQVDGLLPPPIKLR